VALEPIVFHKLENGELVVENPWPRATAISPMVILSPLIVNRDAGAAVSKDKDIITIWVANGSAAYRVRNITSEGDYICDLIPEDAANGG
jgi:hypothetical protein